MNRSGWRIPGCGWWLMAVGLLLGRQLSVPVDGTFLVAPLHEGILTSAAAWDVPLSRWDAVAVWLRVPVWAACVAAACVVAWLATAIGRRRPWLAAFTVAALCAALRPQHAVLLLLAGLTGRIAARWSTTSPSGRRLLAAVVLLLVAALTTLDFGFVLFLLLVIVLADSMSGLLSSRSLSAGQVIAVILLPTATVTAAVGLGRSFLHAALRPLQIVRLGLEPELFPELASPWTDVSLWPSALFLLLVAAWEMRKRLSEAAGRRDGSAASVLLTVTVLGLCSRWWLAPAIAVVAAIVAERPGVAVGRAALNRHRLTWQVAGILGAGLFLVFAMQREGWQPGLAGLPSRQVDLTAWSVDGSVLLTRPEHAVDWKGGQKPPRTDLLLDERTDVQPEMAVRWAAICDDVRDGRNERYLRSDATWGGYAPLFERWSPALIVLDSDDHRAIRQLSLDPAWNVMAIDARRTIFGDADRAGNALQSRRAGTLVFRLEWPDPRVQVSLEGTLEFGTAADARRVAGVLNAMRLPYAALRVLPDDNHSQTQEIRAWAWTELSLRAVRQTGRRSLVDQFRAVRSLDTLSRAGRLSPVDQDRVATLRRSLQDTSTESRPAVEQLATTGTEIDALTSVERQIRDHILQGDRAAVRALLPRLASAPLRAYYAAIVDLASDRDVWQTEQIFRISDSSELPLRIREELNFYRGCLALELPDAAGAVEFLRKSRQLRRDSAWSELRGLYLQQLGAALKNENQENI